MPKKLAFSSKFGYGTGSVAISASEIAFDTFLLFYYTQILGLSGTLSGAALLVGLVADAFFTPVMGSISDNFRSRFGRRHPFMALAAVPFAISTYLLFVPPEGIGQIALFGWMTAFVIANRLLLTSFMAPYFALGAELSSDYAERTTISTYRTIFGVIGGVTISIIAFTFFFPQTDNYILGQMNPDGYPRFALFCACIICTMVMCCVLFTRKEIPFLPKATERPSRVCAMQLMKELKMALKNHTFRIFFMTSLFSGVLGGLFQNLQMHVNTYFWEFDSKELALMSTSIIFAAVVVSACMQWLKKVEKKKVFIIACFLNLFYGVPVTLRLFGYMPTNGSPMLLPIIYFFAIYISVITMIEMIIGGSIIADSVDEGELITGERQEGVYFAILAFNSKICAGIGTLLCGLLIDYIGLPKEVKPQAIDPSAIWNLGLFIGPILNTLSVIPFLIILRLRISRNKMVEIRQQLDSRKAVKASC